MSLLLDAIYILSLHVGTPLDRDVERLAFDQPIWLTSNVLPGIPESKQTSRIERNFRNKFQQIKEMLNLAKKDPICYNCDKVGHYSPECRKPPRTCNICQKEGHMAKFCSKIKDQGSEKRDHKPKPHKKNHRKGKNDKARNE